MMEDKIVRGSKRNFFMVSNDVFKLGLNPHDFVVYVCLLRYADNSTRQAFPGYERLAKDCNMSRRKVIESVKVLEEKGLVKKEVRFKDGRNTSNLYIVFDAEQMFRLNEVHPGVNEVHPRGCTVCTLGVHGVHPEKYLLKNTIDEKEAENNRKNLKLIIGSLRKSLELE